MKNLFPFLCLLPFYFFSLDTNASNKQLSPEDARHFQRRTGFEVDRELHQKLIKMNAEKAIDYLLSRARTTAITPPREWMDEFEEIYLSIIKHRRGLLNKDERKRVPILAAKIVDMFPYIPSNLKDNFKKSLKDPKKLMPALNMLSNKVLSRDLQAWWFEEMLHTSSPLTERMTLFWHNHFATSYRKVKVLPWVYKQNTILRRHALGNFKDLLKEVSTDAAMLWYLDSNKNIKTAPNENFAREVMELFTLGEGNYTEKDVKEAARAFTGWDFDKFTGKFVLKAKRHDSGMKTILSKKGPWNGHQVLDLLLGEMKTAEFITTKLWREFISPNPNPQRVSEFAKKFYQSGYEIKVVLREIFSSKEFYQSKGSLIKSPIDLLVGTLRQFNIDPVNSIPYALASQQLGQELMTPPNVKGWPGGKKWINTASLLTRKDFLSRMFRVGQKKVTTEKNMMKNPMQMMAQMSAIDMEQWKGRLKRDELSSILHALPAAGKIENRKNILAWTRQLVLDPAYQLR